ncbi:hypothetical protein LOY90_001125 [Ophidiomyces ophidiicola]|nr:hypothetical protein LOY90_001125 [Ophidiomyces ophidiicola]
MFSVLKGAKAPPPSSANQAHWEIISIEHIESDGVEQRWPKSPEYQEADHTGYLEKLAKLWMKNHGELEPGKHYILSALPEGYILLSRERKKDPQIRDKFLYGHPSGHYFNSILKFWDHFVYLMTGKVTPCTCDLCRSPERKAVTKYSDGMARQSRSKRKSTAKPTRELKSRVAHKAVHAKNKYLAEDEEGNQDVFKELIHNLKSQKTLDIPVVESDSMDWRAEREHLEEHLAQISMQGRFIPRIGELVLWIPNLKGAVDYDLKTKKFQEYHPHEDRVVGSPAWRAGTVTQVPAEPIVLNEIFFRENETPASTAFCFRIETFPDPNSADKSFSCQYKYVPLSHIRPLNMWDIYLQNIPFYSFHPSILNALTIMSSFSMLDKYHFKGVWPDASISCKGIYLGAELLVVGDVVRLVPSSKHSGEQFDKVTDILAIDEIQLNFVNCNADLSSPQLCEKFAPVIIGHSYTNNPGRLFRDSPSQSPTDPNPMTAHEIVESFDMVAMRQYGPWYRVHPESDKMHVSVDQIMGRLYESDYVKAMFGTLDLSYELQGVIGGRQYGQNTDERIAEGKQWFAGDYRLETLALETFNGIEIGNFDEARDLKMWRANLRILDGTATPSDIRDSKIPRAQGRLKEQDIIGGRTESSKFTPMKNTSSMVSTALAPFSIFNTASSKGAITPNDDEDDNPSGLISPTSDDDTSDDSLVELMQVPMALPYEVDQADDVDYEPAFSSQPHMKRQKRYHIDSSSETSETT